MEKSHSLLNDYFSSISSLNSSWTEDETRQRNISRSNKSVVCQNGWQDIEGHSCLSSELFSKYFPKRQNSNLEDNFPFYIETSNSIGRHLINKRFIQAGEVILIEPAIILAPIVHSPFSKSKSYCLNCLSEAGFFTCSMCGFFFCNESCITTAHKEECHLLKTLQLADGQKHIHRLFQTDFQNQKKAFENIEEKTNAETILLKAVHSLYQPLRKDILKYYPLIAVLRTILLRENNPALGSLIQSLQADVDVNSQHYLANQSRIVNTIRDKIGIKRSEEELHELCSIWDTNAFEVLQNGSTKGQGIYIGSSLLTHSCLPNCEQWFTGRYIVVRACQDIEIGSILTISYTDNLWPTRTRIDHLKMTKKFTCNCPRCTDRTELGTFMGSPLCKDCKISMLHSDPLSLGSHWTCEKCAKSLSTKEIVLLDASTARTLPKINAENLLSAKEILQTSQNFHPNYHLLLRLDAAIIKQEKNIHDMNAAELSLKKSIAENLVDVVKKISPKLSRQRARVVKQYLAYLMAEKKNATQEMQLVKDGELASLLEDYKLVYTWNDQSVSSIEQ